MVGKKIKKFLADKGIKQTYLAMETGLSDSAISDICNNDRRIEITEYYKICKALNVSLEQFLAGIEEED